MENVIDQLLSIDQQAQQILESAKEYEQTMSKKILSQKQSLHTEFQNKADAHIQDVLKTESDSLADLQQTSDQEYRTLLETLEQNWNQNHLDWENSLFERCVAQQKSGETS